MTRHPFDPISFLFGAAFAAFAAVLLTTDSLTLFEATWLWPVTLIVVGAALLLAPLGRRSRQPAPVHEPPQWPDDEPPAAPQDAGTDER